MGNLVGHYSPLGVKHSRSGTSRTSTSGGSPSPSPARYAEMLRKAYIAGPRWPTRNVTIIAGAMALARDNESGTHHEPPHLPRPGMYRAGAAGHFDALSFHPYTGTEDPRIVAYWNLIDRRRPRPGGDHGRPRRRRHEDLGHRVRLLDRPPRQGGVRGRAGPACCGSPSPMWQEQPYAGPLFLFTYRDMGTDPLGQGENYGLVKRDFTPKQALAAVRQELPASSTRHEMRKRPRPPGGAVPRPATKRSEMSGDSPRMARRIARISRGLRPFQRQVSCQTRQFGGVGVGGQPGTGSRSSSAS